MNLPKRYSVLFVCFGNACRSPMAEAIARQTAEDILTPSSAGTMALGFVAPFTLCVLEERGIAADGLHSKPLTRAAQQNADIIINMTGVPADGAFEAGRGKTEDWDVPDPFGMEISSFRDTCDDIEARMTEFTARLRARRAGVLAGSASEG
ncbi:MAG TPA: low molecular weight phosphatase family protein [Candidatus Acidoferrum sp.]|nr:low molecular weight phosphatase family protein [Candidatus Acidoferrum sp.]